MPAWAQTTLVSNTGQTQSDKDVAEYATKFTTGSNTNGYTISSVAIQLSLTVVSGRSTVVTIRQGSGTNPGTLVATLTNPSRFRARALHTFNAPKNTVLNASTTYFLVVNDGRANNQANNLSFSLTSSDTQTGATGWSIANGSRQKENGSWSGTSNSLRFAIRGVANAAPKAPTSVRATAGDGRVLLRWANPNNIAITDYQYNQRTGPTNWSGWQDISDSGSNTTRHTITGLTNGTEYTFVVRARVGSLNGPESSPYVSATPRVAVAPAAPANVSATIGVGQVTLSWDNPNNIEITGYQYRQRRGTTWGTWTNIPSSGPNTTRHTVTGLTNGTEYTFAVRARVGSLIGPESSPYVSATPTLPVITITPSPQPVTEGERIFYTFSASPATSANLQVKFTVADAPHADFMATRNQGSLSERVFESFSTYFLALRTERDDADEPSGPVTVTVVSGTGYTVGTPNTASVMVNDDDPTTSEVTGTTAAIAEGSTKAFTVSIGRALRAGESLEIPLTFTGTATRGTDYTTACPASLPTGVTCTDLNNTGSSSNPRVTFTGSEAGSATSVTLTLTAMVDSDTEESVETVNINAGTPAASGLGGGASATTDGFGEFSINNVVLSSISLSVSGTGAITEGDPALTLTATRSGANSRGAALSIPIRIKAAGTTAKAADYTAASSISIADGKTTGTTSFGVTDDGTDELAETVVIELGMLPAGIRRGATSEVEITITDNDPTTVVLTTPDATATDGSSDDLATLRLTLGRALRTGERLQVPLGFSGGTLDTDFTLSLSGSPAGVMLSDSTVTFSGNVAASATVAEVLLSASEDADTADETVTVSIPSGTAFTPRLTATGLDGGATGSRTGDGQITLIDTTPEKPVNFTATAGNGQVTLNWTNPNNSNITGWQYQQKAGTGNYGSWTTIPGSTAATTTHTATGLISGTVYTLRIRAVAGTTNGVASDEATATPRANSVPTVTNMIPDQTATVGAAFNYQFPENTFSDADNDPLSYTAAKGDDTALPSWLSFNANNRTFSGTPQAGDAGTVMVKVTASDGNGGMISDSFDITVGEEEALLGISTAEDISIYPNPASNYFKLVGAPTGLNGIVLVSTSGKAVRHYPVSKDGIYDISELGEGIFFVFIEGDEGQRYAGRILIKREQN